MPVKNDRFDQITGERDYLPRVPRLSGSEQDPDPDPGTHTHPHPHRGPSTASPALVELMRMTPGGVGPLDAVDEPPAVAVLRAALEEKEPLVREHAAWALERAR